jgi:hypothetical protein
MPLLSTPPRQVTQVKLVKLVKRRLALRTAALLCAMGVNCEASTPTYADVCRRQQTSAYARWAYARAYARSIAKCQRVGVCRRRATGDGHLGDEVLRTYHHHESPSTFLSTRDGTSLKAAYTSSLRPHTLVA